LASDIRVLVVDDEPAVRESMAEYLRDSGFQATAFGSGEEALESIRSHAYHVAIVDIRLPRIDGEELILRAHAKQPHMRYLIFTGSATYLPPESLHAIGITTDHIFFKPIEDLSRICRAIHALVDNA
jgi:DNA-binding NtrC family response regulator